MEIYAKVLSYAIPAFVILIIIEYIASLIMRRPVNTALDTISSLSSGMTNTLKDVLGLSVVIVSYGWLHQHLAVFSIASPFWMYLVAFVLIDFASYWSHRFNHEYNVMWNRHIVHHSSEEFNLSCALRQSISGIIGVYFFLYVPMAVVGIPPKVIALMAPLHLFAQFWYHTRLIGKMGFLEQILMTPSHHRVHHAINPEYLDKNYAAIFVIWDKLFGTFQEEQDDIPPVYGVKRQVKTWNPFIINYQHFWLLIKDAWRTSKLWDKVRIWFMPTGWRPADVLQMYPVDSVQDVYQMKKYSTVFSPYFQAWYWAQLIINNLFLYHLLVSIADLSTLEILQYSLFIVLSIFAYTSAMDKSVLGIVAEGVKLTIGVWLLITYSSWFGLEKWLSEATWWVGTYMFLSMILSVTSFYTQSDKVEVHNTDMAY